MRSSASNAAISFVDAGKRFGDTWVLRHLDLMVERGTVFGMIGPSGCGKTTTVRMALGYHRADEGEVTLLGDDPVTRSLADRKSVGYLPQHPVLFEELSLRQNLNYHASLNGVRLRRRDRLEELFELVALDGHESKRVDQVSGGMKRRLALAATLVHEPPLLMLDEPTAGIDPILRRELWDEFRRLRDTGTTLVVTTQFVEEAAYCDRVAILADGAVASVGTPDELTSQAYGGRRYDLQFDRAASSDVVEALSGAPSVSSAVPLSRDSVRIVVGHEADVVRNASEETRDLRDAIVERLDAQVGSASIVAISEVPVDWNDAFAQIVDRGDDESNSAHGRQVRNADSGDDGDAD